MTCGVSMNFDWLRFVAERAEIGEKREAVFAVNHPRAEGEASNASARWSARAA